MTIIRSLGALVAGTACLLPLLAGTLTSYQLGQTRPPDVLPNWKRISLAEVGTIDIPPTMEIQGGDYQELVDEFREHVLTYPEADIVIQPKGLNELEEGATSLYARVIVDSEYGDPGDYENLSFNTSKYTRYDVLQMNSDIRGTITSGFHRANMKLIEWYPVKLEKINGMSCIHVKYKRQMNEAPVVLVNMFMFHNNDRAHYLTLSYRLNEESYWKVDMARILTSFRITNTR